MGHIVAITNLKGGVAKTTTTINLAGVLSDLGKHVLIVDIDPQANSSIGLGVDIFNLSQSIRHVLLDDVPIEEIITHIRPKIDIAPSEMELAFSETRMYEKYKREDRLKKALVSVVDSYDFILVDCPPNMGIFVINAISACEGILIPMSCDFYSMVGVSLLLRYLNQIKTDINPMLRVIGILVTRYDTRTKNAPEILQETRNSLGDTYKVFDTIIRETVRIKEQPIEQKTITEYSNQHFSADDYRNFTKEFLNEFN